LMFSLTSWLVVLGGSWARKELVGGGGGVLPGAVALGGLFDWIGTSVTVGVDRQLARRIISPPSTPLRQWLQET
ncbi:MAG: hypothetical protein AAGA46_15415, partial [Cyanobacteria bacterium P01_F01_bin.13]